MERTLRSNDQTQLLELRWGKRLRRNLFGSVDPLVTAEGRFIDMKMMGFYAKTGIAPVFLATRS